MPYLAVAIIALLIAWLFFGEPYREAARRRKDLERRGRIKKASEATDDRPQS